jgi:hypothetical protein
MFDVGALEASVGLVVDAAVGRLGIGAILVVAPSF